MEAACTVLGVEKGTSMTYRPESQGNVERQNRTLIKDMTKCLMEHKKSWVDHLPYVEMTHNMTPYSRTGMSPYYVFYGREPPVPTFTELEESGIKNGSYRDFIKGLKVRVQGIHEEARKRTEEKRQKEKEQYDKKAKHIPFKDGEMVYDYVQKKYRSKLDPKWQGPMRIQRRRSSSSGASGTTYVCEKEDGSTCERNYEQLKKVNAEFDKLMQTPAERRIKGEPSSRQGLGATVLAILSQAGTAPEGTAMQVQPHPPIGENDPAGPQVQGLGDPAIQIDEDGEEANPEEHVEQHQVQEDHLGTLADAEATMDEDTATPTNPIPDEGIEEEQLLQPEEDLASPPTPHRAASSLHPYSNLPPPSVPTPSLSLPLPSIPTPSSNIQPVSASPSPMAPELNPLAPSGLPGIFQEPLPPPLGAGRLPTRGFPKGLPAERSSSRLKGESAVGFWEKDRKLERERGELVKESWQKMKKSSSGEEEDFQMAEEEIDPSGLVGDGREVGGTQGQPQSPLVITISDSSKDSDGVLSQTQSGSPSVITISDSSQDSVRNLSQIHLQNQPQNQLQNLVFFSGAERRESGGEGDIYSPIR